MTTSTYADFDLLITPAAKDYQARVLASPAGQDSAPFVLPFGEAELGCFSWLSPRILRHMRLVPPADAPQPLDAKMFGSRLYDALFGGALGRLLARSIDEAARNNSGLRIRLRLGDVPELATLPWEYLYSTELARFLALSDQTPIVRYLELPLRERTLTVTPPLTILAILADPTDLPPLALAHEWELLQRALAPLVAQEQVRLERLPAADLPTLQGRLRRGDVHILHFIGHGDFEGTSEVDGQGLLAFVNPTGQAHPVSGEQLGMLLHDHEALRLVFLNACQGAQGSKADPFVGVAQTLIQQGIPAVVAMQFPVSDNAAITLAQEFYRALADGYGIDAAVSEARKAIFLTGAADTPSPEWGTPVLFTRTDNGDILAAKHITEEGASSSAEGPITVTVNVANSTLTASSINIQQGVTSEPMPTTTAGGRSVAPVSQSSIARARTEVEGALRRHYRQIIALDDKLLFSDDDNEKELIQRQIDAQLAELGTQLRPYAEEARRQVWQIPADLQAALARIGG